jgi:hypothetical protein
MFILRTSLFPGPSAACAGELGHEARKAPDQAPQRIKESVKPHPNSTPENVLHCKNIIRTLARLDALLGSPDRRVLRANIEIAVIHLAARLSKSQT